MEVFRPTDPAFVADPYPAYEQLRRGPRVQYDALTDRWLVARHADVEALLRDRRLGRTYLHGATHAEMGRPDDPPEHAPFWRVVRAGMLDVEPPDHTRLRPPGQPGLHPPPGRGAARHGAAVADRLVEEVVGPARSTSWPRSPSRCPSP